MTNIRKFIEIKKQLKNIISLINETSFINEQGERSIEKQYWEEFKRLQKELKEIEI